MKKKQPDNSNSFNKKHDIVINQRRMWQMSIEIQAISVQPLKKTQNKLVVLKKVYDKALFISQRL